MILTVLCGNNARRAVAFIGAVVFTLLFVATDADDNPCRLYLAPSSTSTDESPRLGIFAGIDYDPNVTIGNHEIAIQILNWAAHNRKRKDEEQGQEEEDEEEQVEQDPSVASIFRNVEQYMWTPDSTGAQFEGRGSVVTIIPGVGILGNYHKGIINADWDQTTSLFRHPMGEQPGVAHPGRGAYTAYYNVSIKSVQPIPAGMEIFVDFGEEWEAEGKDNKDGDEEEEEDPTITRSDYKKMDEVVDKILGFMEKYKEEMTDQVKHDIYNFLTDDVLRAATGAKAEALRELLPADPDELQIVKDMGGTLLYNEHDIKRDLDWLKENGQCMDNIRAGPSTIPDAGRGAFATRSIQKGGLVSPVPLIPITNEAVLDMYELQEIEQEDGRKLLMRVSDQVEGQQLLFNYCFGHPESSLLLYPFATASNLINHKPSSEANAKLVWSSSKSLQKNWFELDPDKFNDDDKMFIGLMFDIVATRDIAPDEEIFIDYGAEWADAWNEHVQSWTQNIESGEIEKEWPLRALDLNEIYRNRPLKTPAEREEEPYSDGVMTTCFVPAYKDVPIGEKRKDKDGNPIYSWDGGEFGNFKGDDIAECDVLERIELDEEREVPYNYTVYLKTERLGNWILKHVPHIAVQFTDKPYRGDQSTKHAFRHYIGIPDDIFPQPWRNLVEDDLEDEGEQDEEVEGEQDEEVDDEQDEEVDDEHDEEVDDEHDEEVDDEDYEAEE